MKKRFSSAPQWQEQDLIDVHTTHAVDTIALGECGD